MAYEMKDGQGSLFRNSKKEKDNHPDYTGKLMLGGVEYRLAAWLKEGNTGKWMSISATVKEDAPKNAPQPSRSKAPSKFDDLHDDLPF